MGILTEIDELSLTNLGGGAAYEKFAYALRDVLRNIQDPNTSHKDIRKIILEVGFAPYEDRSGADITINCTTKLVSLKGFASRVMIGRGASGQVEVRELLQADLFPKSDADNVYTIQKGENVR
jgi:hypothetical protein